jgi:CHAD domain-containing protein
MDSAGLTAVTGAVGAAFARAVDLRRSVKPTDTETIHKLRVAFKKFRYTVEALQPILVGVTDAQFKAMNAYQVRMGNIQDVEVLSASVERHAMHRTRVPYGARRRNASRRGRNAAFVPVLQELSRRRAGLIEQFLGSADELFDFWKKPVPMPEDRANKTVPLVTGTKSD